MCIALNPVCRSSSLDPGRGIQLTLREGSLPAMALDEIGKSWPDVVNIAEKPEDVPWESMFEFIHSLFDPGLARNDESKAAADQLLNVAVSRFG